MIPYVKAPGHAPLDACGWQVAGPKGAAARLGMKPSTLASRIKALGLERPAS